MEAATALVRDALLPLVLKWLPDVRAVLMRALSDEPEQLEEPTIVALRKILAKPGSEEDELAKLQRELENVP